MIHRHIVGLELFAFFYGAVVFAKGNECLFGLSNAAGGLLLIPGFVIMALLLHELDLEHREERKRSP